MENIIFKFLLYWVENIKKKIKTDPVSLVTNILAVI